MPLKSVLHLLDELPLEALDRVVASFMYLYVLLSAYVDSLTQHTLVSIGILAQKLLTSIDMLAQKVLAFVDIHVI